MDIRPIRTDTEHEAALREIDRLMHATAGSPDGEKLDVLVTLVAAFEADHYPVEAPDPIEAIRFMMEQKGLTRKDLEPAIGSSGRVAEILNRKRPLTLPMIRKLRDLLELPADILVQEYHVERAA